MPRTVLEQTFFSKTLTIHQTPTPIAMELDLSSMIESFVLCNPSSNSVSVFFGDNNVSVTSGIEIINGTSQSFAVRQERVFYELQDLLLMIATKEVCQNVHAGNIPVVVWRPSNIFLICAVAADPLTMSACFFRKVYI